MLIDLLSDEKIQVVDKVKSWEEGVEIAATPLLKKNYITIKYLRSMLDDVKELGPYINIAPGIIMPHSRPENGVLQSGMSILKINNGIPFINNEKIYLVIMLALIDDKSHLNYMSQLATLLMDEAKREELLAVTNVNDLNEVLTKVEK